MFVRRARQVRLFLQRERVFQREQGEGAGGAADMVAGGIDDPGIVIAGHVARACARLAEGAPQHGAVMRAGGAGVVAGQAQALAPGDVPVLPPAQRGRQVVGGGHRDGVGRPVARRAEDIAVALEPGHAQAADAGAFEQLAEPVRQGAKILAEDNGAVAL